MCLAGPVRFTAGLCYPHETLSPGTQHTNRIRVSGFETGKHEGGEERRAAPGFGAEGEMVWEGVEHQSNEGPEVLLGRWGRNRHSTWVGRASTLKTSYKDTATLFKEAPLTSRWGKESRKGTGNEAAESTCHLHSFSG